MDQTIIKKPEFRATTNDGTTIKVISKFLKNFHKRGPVGMIIRKKSIIFISNDKDLGMAYKINLKLKRILVIIEHFSSSILMKEMSY